MDPQALVWIDGRVRRRDEAGIPVDDSGYAEGRGCYTTARIRGGLPRFEALHLRRLARGAAALRLGPFDEREAVHALRDLAAAAFPGGEGVVRVQLSRGRDGVRVVGIPRGLGDDPPVWSAVCAKIPHPPPAVAGGHKLTHRLVHALAMDEAREQGADEALLFDREGRLVEGSRSNVLVADAEDRLWTPPLERGAVDGIARQVLVRRIDRLRERDLRREDLCQARAVLCINAVRGPRPLARLDATPLPAERGPWPGRLAEAWEET